MDYVEVALAEYKALWEYYHQLLGEWSRLIDRYFKVVTLPSAAIAFLLTRQESGRWAVVPVDILIALLSLVFLIGMALYVTYAKECGNANYYERAMARIRTSLRDKGPLKDVLILNDLRNRRTAWTFGGIKFWRGATLALLNSAVGTAALAYIWDLRVPAQWVFKFVVLFGFHAFVHYLIVSAYGDARDTANAA